MKYVCSSFSINPSSLNSALILVNRSSFPSTLFVTYTFFPVLFLSILLPVQMFEEVKVAGDLTFSFKCY